jgi:thiamine biosynthesis lipoprotein
MISTSKLSCGKNVELVTPSSRAQSALKVPHSPHKTAITAFAMAATLGCLLLTQACSAPVAPVTRTRDFPYAFCTLTLNDHAEESTFAACFERIEKVLHELNMHSADSEVSVVNRAAGTGAVPVSDDVREILREAMELASLTDGLFDPTVGPLVRLWGVGSENAHVPKPEEIRSALRLVGWRDIVLDEPARTVALRRAGMTLDFGALLKGFAAVEGGRILSARGVRSAIMDIGGSTLALGSRPEGAPWRIGLQKPGAPRGTPFAVVQARDEVVNTSGAYEQFFRANGRRYQHIIDPRTGYPVDNGIEAVTVISSRLRNADGPTLSIMALGVEGGLALAKRLGVDAVIVGSDGTLHMTPGASRRFTLLDPTYRIASH